jgi:uncharacterized protein YecT (DUF1311 family)
MQYMIRRNAPWVALLALGAAALAFPADAAQSELMPASPLWRIDVSHLKADRHLVRTCLSADKPNGQFENCVHVVWDACNAASQDDDTQRVSSRHCDWRAIAAWEDELAVTLAELRLRLSRSEMPELDSAQKGWQSSMLADVRLQSERYAGGSLAGSVGAHVRAEAVARRVVFLEEFLHLVEAND